jgi:anti-sigma factor RsiW
MYECLTIIKLVHAYLDGELDVKEAIRVQTHLEECERCRQLYQDEKAFLDLLPSQLNPPAPLFARQGISDLLSREAARRQRKRRRWAIVLSPAVLAAVVVMVVFFALPRSRVPSLVQVAVSEHERYLRGQHSLGVISRNPQTVMSWLEQRVQMPLYIELEAVPEAQLVGAKAPVRDTQAAYLAYRFGNEPVSLLVAPPREISMSQDDVRLFRNTLFFPGQVEGHQTLQWSDRRHTYVLVAEQAGTLAQACVICHSSDEGRALIAGFSVGT